MSNVVACPADSFHVLTRLSSAPKREEFAAGVAEHTQAAGRGFKLLQSELRLSQFFAHPSCNSSVNALGSVAFSGV